MSRLIKRVSVSFTRSEYEGLLKAAEGGNLSHYIRVLATDADGETAFQRRIEAKIEEVMAGVDLLVESHEREDAALKRLRARLREKSPLEGGNG